MNEHERRFERAARAWLDSGPTVAPDRTIHAALLAIETTPQERDLRVPRRFPAMPMPARLAAAAAILLLVAGGSLLFFKPASNGIGRPTASPSLGPTPAPTAGATSAARLDYSDLPGRILMEHLGNAPDGSEAPTSDYHPERRRLYFMDPKTMTGATAVEFLPGRPKTGKMNADVSRDGKSVVFMDTADPAAVWLASLDGTIEGLRRLSTECACSELDPAFDPTGTKIVFVHLDGALRNSRYGANNGIEWDGSTPVHSWLAIRDLATGKVTRLMGTGRTGADGIPAQPAWSPDGSRIVFDRTVWGANGPTAGSLRVVDVASGVETPIPLPAGTIPGDAVWTPDGSRILFTGEPISEMGSVSDLPANPLPGISSVALDGSDLRTLNRDGAAPSFLPDGRIVYQSNVFWVMDADGGNPLPVNFNGTDLTELAQGFAYVPHWVPAAP